MARIISIVRIVFMVLALAGLGGVMIAQTTQKADESRIEKLVADLGAKDFKVREGATKELTAIGLDARPALAKAAISSDLEVARRAKDILSGIAKVCFETGSKHIQENLLWSCSIKDGVSGRVSIKDGIAYVAGFDHAIHAVDIKTGKEKWSQAQLSQDATATPSQALVSDKMTLAVLSNGDVTGLDLLDGKVKWNYKRERPAEPLAPINPDPAAGVGGGAGIPAGAGAGAGANTPPVNPGQPGLAGVVGIPIEVVNGAANLQSPAATQPVATQPAAKLGVVVGGFAGGNAVGVQVQIGVVNGPVGVLRAFGQTWPLPVVAGSTLYLPQEDSVVLVDTQTGKKLKEIKLAVSAMGAPAVDGDRMIIYLADGTVRGYSLSDGTEVWKHAGGRAIAGAIVCREGKVYFVGDPMTMFALDCATGKEVWHCSTAAEETATPDPNGMRPNHVIGGMISTSAPGQSLTIKDGTIYSLQGTTLIAVDAKEGKKKWQQQIDVWRDETPVMAPGGHQMEPMKPMVMIAGLRPPQGLGQTASPFVIDGNIAYVNAGQLGVYAVGLDDGSAQWALRTNMSVGDMVLLDGVLYFGTSRQGVFNARPLPMLMVQEGVATDPAKPDAQSKDVLPEGLHALKVK